MSIHRFEVAGAVEVFWIHIPSLMGCKSLAERKSLVFVSRRRLFVVLHTAFVARSCGPSNPKGLKTWF